MFTARRIADRTIPLARVHARFAGQFVQRCFQARTEADDQELISELGAFESL